MPDLGSAFAAEDYGDNIEAAGTICYFIGHKKVTCRFSQFSFFILRDDRLDRLKIFVCPGFYLDENNGPAAVDHNQVDFAGPAGVIISKFFQALFFEEDFAAFFTPSAEQFSISQQFPSVQHQAKQFFPRPIIFLNTD